jgi:plasmid maintenance system antidote protein VapI
VSRVAGIVKGTRAITADMALRLGLYLGTSAEMWLALQTQYDLRVAQRTTWPKVRSRIKARAGSDPAGLTPG